MKNTLNFESFLKTLKPTNRNLSFYVDWDKCLKNKDKISISLNHLNFLLGRDSSEIKEAIITLFSEYKKAFEILPLLLAVRDFKESVLDKLGLESSMQEYLKSPQGVYDFIYESGLLEIFADKKIKDLNDFVFGMEKEFIIASCDGFTFDSDEKEKENLQILDFVFAKNINEAKSIANEKDYGDYERLMLYEVIR